MYLLATARFVICTPSGPGEFAFYFNVPRVMTNWTFMSGLFGTSEDICIPVSFFNTLENRVVSLKKQLYSPSYYNEPSVRALKEVKLIKNSAKQIKDATVEMIQKLNSEQKSIHFSAPRPDSLINKYGDRVSFLGSISQSFLDNNPYYLD
jgi:putative glycosyltransferase (TIGR04372 family)